MSESKRELRVLGVIPGLEDDTSMWFARRQAATVGEHRIVGRTFFLRSRTSPRTVWKEMRRLRNEIQAFSPDVVHAHFGTVTALVCALVSPVPIVVTFHGQDLNPSPGTYWPRWKLGQMFSHIAARRANQIICVSPGVREHIAYVKDRVHLLPCGINMERFRPMPKDECRAKLGWKFDEQIMLFNAGSNPIRKRIDLAQAAFAHAKRRIPNLRLHVFGGNTLNDEMPLYYNAADCLLVASDYEGSPMVVKEAMACNLPVVSVDVGDVVERLAGVSPSAIVARDPAALGDAVVDIISLGCRSNGREMMRDLSEEAIAAKIVSIYRLAAGVDASERIGDRRIRSPLFRSGQRQRVGSLP